MFTLYRQESYNDKYNAQRNLLGRTHYVDDDTMRSFKSRILTTVNTDDGLLFALVESCSGDYEHKTRIFRPVIFDVFGNVLHRPDLEQSFKTGDQARKAMREALNEIDAVAVTRKAIASQEANYAREIKDARATLANIESEAAA